MNTLEDDLIEAAKLRLLDAAETAARLPLCTMDPELEPMDAEEIQPGVLLAGFYYLPLLVLTRTEDRVRVAPTSPLSSATLPSEARLRWGQGALVFCGWGERECTLADLQPAVWCGSLNEETLGKVRHILETGREKEKLLLPSLQQAAACYKKAASYPWSSCFPAMLTQAEENRSVRILWEIEPEETQTLQLKAKTIKRPPQQALRFESLPLSEQWLAMAAADTARPLLDQTYTKQLKDGQLTLHLEEDRLRGKVVLTMRLEGETRKAPLRVIIQTAKSTYSRELRPNRGQFQELTVDEIGGNTLAYATEELSP